MYWFTGIYYINYWKGQNIGGILVIGNILKLQDHKELEEHRGDFTAWKQILEDFIMEVWIFKRLFVYKFSV